MLILCLKKVINLQMLSVLSFFQLNLSCKLHPPDLKPAPKCPHLVSLEAALAGVLPLQGDPAARSCACSHHTCPGSSLPFLSLGVPAATGRVLKPLLISCSSSGPCPLSRGELMHPELKGESSVTHRAGGEGGK